MFGIHDFALFVLAGWLLNITPGPDMMYIVGRSATQGWRGGAMAALGVTGGCFVHIAAATLGLSALLIASATAFTVVKIAGAVYLVYVGLVLLRSTGTSLEAVRRAAPEAASLRAIFYQGFFTNALNPKVALFFLAFLPQFIEADAPMKPLAFFVLGLVFTVNGTLWNLFVAWAAARVTRGISTRTVAWFERCIGAFFIVLGVRLALARNP